MGLREDNKRRTAERIVDTAGDLVRRAGAADFTMPEVADAAGVGLRTLYRYFPTRDALVAAVARLAEQTTALGTPASIDEIEAWLLAAWRNLLAEEALMRAQHQSASGRELRRARRHLHRRVTTELVATQAPHLSAEERADAVDVALLACSSAALFEYLDVIEVDVERAARLSARVVAAMLDEP